MRERLEADGDRVIGVDLRGAEVEADLSQPEGRRAAIEGVLERSGGALDRVVACAGLGSHLTDLPLIASVNYFGAVDVLDGLRDAMAGHEMPLDMEERFVRSMAWRDYKIASLAATSWDQKGYLVIVTGRGHVEGGKGVNWQVSQLVDVPVHSFVLAWGKEPPCYPGDQVWRPGLFERRKPR